MKFDPHHYPDCHGMTPTLAACEVGNDQIVSNLLEFVSIQAL